MPTIELPVDLIKLAESCPKFTVKDLMAFAVAIGGLASTNGTGFVIELDAERIIALAVEATLTGDQKETTRYGGHGTIHQTGNVNVETRHGEVVSVWFRCSLLPFDQTEVDNRRAAEMKGAYSDRSPARIVSIESEK